MFAPGYCYIFVSENDWDIAVRFKYPNPTKDKNKTSIRVYAVKSDDDPKALNPKPKEDQRKPVSRIYAVKSDDDPNQETNYPNLAVKS